MLRMLLVLASLLCLTSPATAGYDECVYGNSKIIVSRLNGMRGMVISHWRAKPGELTASNCDYSVRFADDNGRFYTIEKMRPYEIEWPPGEPTPTAEEAPPRPTGVEELDFGG